MAEAHPYIQEPEDDKVLARVFFEVNSHLRTTEEKHLSISVGYMGFLSIALSIMATDGRRASKFIAIATWPNVVAYAVLCAAGCMVIFVQDAYRGWKQHYKIVARTIAEEMTTDPTFHRHFFPYWLQHDPWDHPRILRLSPDNLLTYFTAGATTFLFVLLEIMLNTLIQDIVSRFAVMTFLAVIFVWYFVYLRGRVRKRMRWLADEIADTYELVE